MLPLFREQGIHKKNTGNIEGIVNVDVKPQVTGYLQAVLVKEGQYVQKGQPLFRIMPDVYNEQVKIVMPD